MKTPAYYIKTIVLVILLVLEAFFLTTYLLEFVSTGQFFTFDPMIYLTMGGWLLALIFTYTLTIGAWDKWEQFLVVPLPIAAGIFLGLLTSNTSYAPVIAVVVAVILVYDIAVATNIKSQLLKFRPIIVLRFSTRGILFVFSALAFMLVILQPSKRTLDLQIGEKVGSLAQQQVTKVLEPQLGTQNFDSILLGNPELSGLLGGLQPETSSVGGIIPSFNLDIQNMVDSQIEEALAPFQKFFTPLIAVFVFAFVRFIGGIVHILFNITVTPVFMFLTSIGFFNKKVTTVEKETLVF